MAARLRRDGWISLDAGKPAEVVTKFFVTNGSALVLNLDCRSTNVGHNILETYGNGSVAVEVVGAGEGGVGLSRAPEGEGALQGRDAAAAPCERGEQDQGHE